MIAEQTNLLTRLVRLGLHYPDMRFGQLFEFACVLAGDEEPISPEAATDVEAEQAIVRHLHSLDPDDVGLEMGRGLRSLTQSRGRLVDVIQKLSEQYRGESVGQLLVRLAKVASVRLYDAEDSELADAAGSAFEGS